MDRVLEIGSYSAGFVGRLFVQNGHEVTRIETAQSPAWASSEAMTTFLHAGKERIHANSKDFADLAAKADIVVLEASSADRAEQGGQHGPKLPPKTEPKSIKNGFQN